MSGADPCGAPVGARGWDRADDSQLALPSADPAGWRRHGPGVENQAPRGDRRAALSLILDAGALIAVERADRDTAAVIEVARREHRIVIVPAGVVGQVWRGGSGQARLARLLGAHGVTVEPLTDAGARAARILCGGAGTRDVIDASVVLTAHGYRATVLSSDRSHLESLDPDIPLVDC